MSIFFLATNETNTQIPNMECSDVLHNIVFQVDVIDTWRWLLDPVHDYSVRESYCFITNFGE